MANIFANLAEETKDMEKSTDRIGGDGFIKESDVYDAVVKAAYKVTARSGAVGIGLIFDLADGSEYRETMWITTKEGKPYWMNQNNKKIPLPGFANIDDLCELLTEKPLAAQEAEEKEVKLWNPETKQEEPTLAPVLVELLKKKVKLAILKTRSNKQIKDASDNYVDSSEERFTNSIEKFFHAEYNCTYAEARDKLEFGSFMNKWLEKNKGKTVDKYKEVANTSVRTGNSTGSTGQKVHSSLFDK